MKPYQASGASARLLLVARQCSPKSTRRDELRDALRRYRLAIQGLGTGALVLTPVAAAVTQSPEAALATALLFLALIIPLEVAERRVKRRLRSTTSLDPTTKEIAE